MAIPNGWIYGDCGCCCTTTVEEEDDCECQDSGGGGGDGGVVEVMNLDTVADMTAFVPYTGLKEFQLLGNVTAGDGYGGAWAYFPSSAAVSDGYYVVTPPGGVGRYIKM